MLYWARMNETAKYLVSRMMECAVRYILLLGR